MKDFFKKVDIFSERNLKILVYIALFLSLLYPFSDKDWGWHYKYGEYFLTHGHILVRDIYSWTMEGYAWINHSWLFDPIIYLLTNMFGFRGLMIIDASIALLCFWILTKEFKLASWQLTLSAFLFYQIIYEGVWLGLRSQTLALLPLSFVIYILIKAKENIKLLYWLPLIFYVWGNLHGTFVLGIGITGIFLAFYLFQIPKERVKIITIGITSVIATLLTPFSYHTYLEVLRHTGSPYLRNVTEWMPVNLSCVDCHVPTFAVYVLILIVAFFTINKKFGLPFLIAAIPLLVQSINARRYLPLFGITTFPVLATYIKEQKIDIAKYRITKFLVLFVLLFTIEYNLFSRLPNFHFYTFNEEDYCYYASRCSLKFIDYIKKNPPQGRGMNFYDWGGYFIYKEVPFKLFIDGRMHLWQVKDYSAFGDYIGIYYGNDLEKFRQYNLDWVMAQPDSSIAKILLDPRNSINVGSWKVEYSDEYTLYFVRVN